MMNKYSQSGQDDWVLSIIDHKGYFVDMGSFDGVHYSNTLRLEEEGWEGLCIEPNPTNFELLKQNRRCKLLNEAIATYRGELRMSDEASSSQITTTGNLWVKCDIIENIFKYNGVPRYIDYISSDIERMDAEVWENFPFSKYSFGLATVEHCLYEGSDDFKKRIMKVMVANGYVLAKENIEHDGNKFEDWYIHPKLIMKPITCYLSGRWGNIVFSLAQMIAYAKKYNLKYFVPTQAIAYRHFRNGDVSVPFTLKSTGEEPINPKVYEEPNCSKGTPRYHEIPKMDNVKFTGYFQSFLYFDWCRDYILKTFNFPYEMQKGVVSISVRRGDCLEAPDKFPIAPTEYYYNAIKYMQDRGYNLFRVHSDDQQWCKKEFTSDNYNGAIFQFTEGNEMNDFVSISSCEHNITARSTFSLSAAWFNLNLDKIVLCPTLRHKWWGAQNADLLTGTGFIEIDFDDSQNTLK